MVPAIRKKARGRKTPRDVRAFCSNDRAKIEAREADTMPRGARRLKNNFSRKESFLSFKVLKKTARGLITRTRMKRRTSPSPMILCVARAGILLESRIKRAESAKSVTWLSK